MKTPMRTSIAYVLPLLKSRKSIDRSLILYSVLHHFNISMDQIKAKTRRSENVYWRHVYYYLLKHFYVLTESMEAGKDCTLESIGNEMGQNYATVLHGIKRIENEITYNNQIREDVLKVAAFVKYLSNGDVEN